MKRVSFDVAKWLKDIGYPQSTGEGDVYFDKEGEIWFYNSELHDTIQEPVFCSCPYYLEAWRWLWTEKRIFIEPWSSCGLCYVDFLGDHGVELVYSGTDPEEAIVAAIDVIARMNNIEKQYEPHRKLEALYCPHPIYRRLPYRRIPTEDKE